MEAVVVDTISTGLGGRDEGKLIEMVFPKLNYLRLKGLPKLTSFAIGMTIHSVEFPSLPKLEITDCPNLIRFISMRSLDDKILTEMQPHHFFDEKVIFPSLEELKLDSLTSIKNICHNLQFQYQKLKKVTLWNCKSLKYMFSYSMVNSFEKLEHLDIHRCESMEAVVVDTTSTRLERDEGKLMEMVFPKLNYLSLWELPKLTSFAIGMAIHLVEFSSLPKLEITDCPNLIRFISMSSLDDNILTETQPHHFFDEKVALPNLMTLRVARCNGLRSLMTLSVAQSMMKLTSMEIIYCEKMEEIIQQKLGEEVKDDRIVFSQLTYLDLYNLTSLKSFCLGNYTLEFSSLEHVHVWDCPNMKTFSQGVLLIPKLHEGNLNSTIQKMFKEMVGFHYIWDLRLSLYPYLKEKWHRQELPVSFFNGLRYLEVDGCTDMSSAIPMNLLRCLNNLCRLTVSNCDSLEIIFHLEELNIDEDFRPVLPELELLNLINLPKLRRFCSFTGNLIELHSLTRMRIENCPNMEAFVSNPTSVQMAENKEPQEMALEENIHHFFNENVALPNLMTLHVDRCNGWRSLMTLSMAQSMMKLTSIVIIDCEKMEEIIQQELGEEVKDDRIVFSQLKYLELAILPSLKSFCLGNYTLEFSSLEQVYVYNCPNMKTFSQGVLLTPKLHKVEENEAEYWEEEYSEENEGYWEGNLNSTIQKMFKKRLDSVTYGI